MTEREKETVAKWLSWSLEMLAIGEEITIGGTHVVRLPMMLENRFLFKIWKTKPGSPQTVQVWTVTDRYEVVAALMGTI